MDTYMLAGTSCAMLAGLLLLYRRLRLCNTNSDILQIHDQIHIYKKSIAARKQEQTSRRSILPTNSAINPAKPRIRIFFGSQTGTAESFATILCEEAKNHGVSAVQCDLDQYNPQTELTHERLAIFLMATYGEGEPTDNAQQFIAFLKAQTVSLRLHSLSYTVFGLGNRQYEQFNAVGKYVDRALLSHGAKRFYPFGEGDDDQNLESDFDDWKRNLWTAIRKVTDAKFDASVFKSLGEKDETTAVTHGYAVREVATPAIAVAECQKLGKKYFFQAQEIKMIRKKELRTCTENGSTLHIEFDIRSSQMSYETADTLAILPENAVSDVERVARILSMPLNQYVLVNAIEREVNAESLEPPFPSPCTVSTILYQYLDIASSPRRRALRQLAHYTLNETEKAELLFLSSKDGKKAYETSIVQSHCSFVDVFERFPSIRITLQTALDIVPFLRPRLYTIASSSLMHPQRLHITVAIVKKALSTDRTFNGLCSSYLAHLQLPELHTNGKKRPSRPGQQGDKQVRPFPHVRAFIRVSSFRLPQDTKKPILMIGPGSGIAPMRAFLHERLKQKQMGLDVGKSVLYFGCQHPEKDYIYREELESFVETRILTELHVAFSRLNDRKVYVQNLLSAHGEETYEMLDSQGAHVYVCGGTQMGRDVRQTMQEIVSTFGNVNEAKAKEILADWQANGRFVQELWA